MAEYIEREAAINAMCRLCSDTTRDKCSIADICNHVCRLEAVPAADVVPVERGVWNAVKGALHPAETSAVCSNCGFATMIHAQTFYNFCPNCGANMREES